MTLTFCNHPVYYAKGLFWIIKDNRYAEAEAHPWEFKRRTAHQDVDTGTTIALVEDATPVVTEAFENASDEHFLSPQLRLYFKFVIAESKGEIARPDFAVPLYETVAFGSEDVGWVKSVSRLHERWKQFQDLLKGDFNVFYAKKQKGYVAAHASIKVNSSNYKFVGTIAGVRNPLFGWLKEDRYAQIHPSLSSFVRHHLCYCAGQPFTKRMQLFPITELRDHHSAVPWKSGRLSRGVLTLITKWKSQQSWGK